MQGQRIHPTTDPRWGPRQQQAFSGPIPGQSLTLAPKSTPWQKPPQFPDIESAMNFIVDQMTETQNFKELMFLMKNKISVEEIARTLLFTGFTLGRWTINVALLMYRPLMATLIVFAHRAGIKDAPLVMKHRLNKNDLPLVQLTAQDILNQKPTEQPLEGVSQMAQGGFMRRF